MRYTNDRKNNLRDKQKERQDSVKKLKMKIVKAGLIALVATGAVSATIGKEVSEIKTTKRIEQTADIDVVRSFRNLNTKKMGKYLNNQIELLYSKYPNLDEAIFEGNDLMKNYDFIKDIYSLYKAHMVDKASLKESIDINNVKVTTVDQLILSSDRIETKAGEKIKETHAEQDKIVTGEFLKAKSTNNAQEFAKVMYEYLANEYGLISKTISSKNSFYYNQITGDFYTKNGIALLIDKNEAQKNDRTSEIDDYMRN